MENIEARQRPNESHIFRKTTRRLTSGLQDNGTSLPGVFTPEWPNFPPETVSAVIDNQALEIEDLRAQGEVSDNQAEILHAQVRAIDYLYGRREQAIEDDEPENLLVDILTLISAPSDFNLTEEGAPKPKRFLGKVDKSLKPEQYTYFENSSGRSEYRTLASFGRNLSTVIRGLHVLGEAAKHHPVFIRSAINQYSERVKAKNSPIVTNTSLGLLEILNNTNLLYDARFRPLAEQLRDVVFEDVSNYTELKQRFPYMVLGKRAFWYNGEVQANGRRKNLKYLKTEDGKRADVKEALTYEFPSVTDWTHVSRKRQEMGRQIRGLTMTGSVRRTALDFNEDRTIEAVKQDRIRKADLKEGVRNLQRAEVDRLTRGWRRFLIEQIDEEVEVTSQELEYLSEAVTLISKYFLPDETLSQKTKTNIRLAEEDGRQHYKLDLEELARDPLCSWIFATRNPYVAESIKTSLEKSPENAESFFLLLKLMTYKLAEGSVGKRELDFLFDPSFRQKVDSESLLKLFNSIRVLADKFIPDVREVVSATLAKRDTEIEDLLSEERLKATRKKLEELTYRRILRFIKYPKSRQFTPVDKKLAAKTASRIVLVTGGLAGILLGYKAGDAIYDSIGEAKEIERQKELQASARQAVAEELEKQQKQKEIERLMQLNEQARQNVDQRQDFQNEGTSAERQKANEAYEAVVSLATNPEKIDDRIPDAIDRESVERIGLTTFGKIYHLPEFMEGADGEYVGYFPWDLNMQLYKDITDYSLFNWYRWDGVKPLEDYTLVDAIDNYSPAYSENQLAYSPNSVNSVIYPPVGWKVVRVIQEGGKQPMLGAFGEVYYGYDDTQDNFPRRVLLILEQTPLESLHPRINRLTDLRLRQYWPYFWQPRAERANQTLSADPILHAIHSDFISEMKEAEEFLDNLFRQSLNLANEDIFEYFEKTSQIAVKYATLYAQYTDSNRYYALAFSVDANNGEYASLKSIAQNPDAGYFCSTASFAFRDFMNSAGFVVANQPGMPMVNYRDYLWGKLGHQNSVVFLPNGEILEVDMTPPVTSRTPIEDLQALAGRYVSPEDIAKAIEDMVKEQQKTAEGITEEAPANDTAVNSYDDYEKTRALRLNPNYISSQERNQSLENIRETAASMITDRFSQDFTSQVNMDNQERRDEINALRSIENNVNRLSESAPSLEDIVLGKASPEAIEETVKTLDRIIQDYSQLFGLLDKDDPSERIDFEELSQIALQTTELKQSYEVIAGNMLEQLRQDRAYVQSIEQELMRFRRYTKPADVYTGDEIERIRFERDRELRREAESQDLYFIYEMRDIAKIRLDYVSEQIRHETDDFYPHKGLDMDTEIIQDSSAIKFYYDNTATLSPLVPQANELERLINNTPWLTSRLTDEENQKIASFSEVVVDLKDTLEPASNLTPEQQLVRLSSQYSKLQEITDIIDRVWNDRIQDEREQEQEIARFNAYSERYLAQLNAQPEVEEVEDNEAGQSNNLAKIAGRFGLGLASVAALSGGLRLRRKIKDQKALQERIRNSFSASKNLTRQEKDIVVATAGNLALMSYDKRFPQKLAGTLNLLVLYSPDNHAKAIDWLSNEGFEVSEQKSAQEAYERLVFSSNGGSPNHQVLAEIRRNFPYHIGEEVARLSKLHNGKGSAHQISDVPHDFVVAYQLARMLSTHNIATLMRDVFARLNISNGPSDVSVPYKVDDISEFLREKYSSGDIPEEVKPLFNAVYHLLEGRQLESA